MKIILANGKELDLIKITSDKRDVQGAYRNLISFVFEGSSVDEVDKLFTESACESIKIVDGEEIRVYNGYAIRAELKQFIETITPETADEGAVNVTRVQVSMAQRTYTESKLAALAMESIDTQMAVAELAELLAGGAK